MKISFRSTTFDGKIRLTAETGDYDATPPISELVVESTPLFQHHDILAVASVLVFGEYASGPLELPASVSPETAEAIEEFMAPTWISISPIEFEPRNFSEGEGEMAITDDLGSIEHVENQWGKPRRSVFVPVESNKFAGSIASTSGLIVASNAAVIDNFSRYPLQRRASIAAALIFCESYRASALVPDPSWPFPGQKAVDQLKSLVRGCNINLRWSNESF